MSITTQPRIMAPAASFSTSLTCVLVGKMVISTSAPAATAAAPSPARPPTSAANRAARPLTASATATWNPARTRFAAMGQPMFPMPTKPTVRAGSAHPWQDRHRQARHRGLGLASVGV